MENNEYELVDWSEMERKWEREHKKNRNSAIFQGLLYLFVIGFLSYWSYLGEIETVESAVATKTQAYEILEEHPFQDVGISKYLVSPVEDESRLSVIGLSGLPIDERVDLKFINSDGSSEKTFYGHIIIPPK